MEWKRDLPYIFFLEIYAYDYRRAARHLINRKRMKQKYNYYAVSFTFSMHAAILSALNHFHFEEYNILSRVQ